KAVAPSIVECPNCHDMMLSHRICKNCGQYDGREIIAKVDVN
ncbi:MAG: 50S ribosomal protein L32, partial [Clostridiaceae bacterium]